MADSPALPDEIQYASYCLQVAHGPAKVILIYPVFKCDDAYRELHTKYYNQVKKYAAQFYESSQDAEDATQDVFLKLWEKREKLQRIETIENYLFTMVRNHFINDRRSHVRKKAAYGYYKYKETIYANVTEQDVNFKETKRLLDKSIQKLPARMKLVFLLKNDGYTRKEISLSMGIHPNTVKQHLASAVERVEACLKAM